MRVELIDTLGSDLTVVNAARVSFAKQSEYKVREAGWEEGEMMYVSELSDKDRRLINYLAKHGHWTPFAHCFLQFRIKAPVFVARQLVKHQVGLVWNEVSRRYVDDEPEMYLPSTWRGKPENSKQGSDGVADSQYFPSLYMREVNELAVTNYNKMIAQGVAPEMARAILPQSMMTEWYWSGSLHAFARVVKQRTDPHAQEETRVVAEAIEDELHNNFPWAAKALLNG